MRPFTYRRPQDEHSALDLMVAQPGAAFVAGGTDLLQLWKAGVAAPGLVIDIGRLPLDAVEEREGKIAIGALARLSDIADHPLIRRECPAVAQALIASASPQLRNMATIGGNLLQRSRCAYFRNVTLPCNKRQPGSGCGAISGQNRLHAILGASEACAATHPSDLAVALVALEAVMRLRSAAGERTLPVEDFFLLPGEEPWRETALAPGELIVAVELPGSALARRSCYVKLRDRASFEFAVVSVAAALEVEDGIVRAARLAAGGVGTKPWRLRASEAALAGVRLGEAAFREAARLASNGASALSQNAFKIGLLERIVLRALEGLGGLHDAR